jgi:antitoxin component YwqK of YwqJK toxin-antitoxin module
MMAAERNTIELPDCRKSRETKCTTKKRGRDEEDESTEEKVKSLGLHIGRMHVAKKVRFQPERIYEENDFGSAAFSLRAGVKDGAYQTWYPNGQRKELATMSAGREHGLVQQWFPNGQPYMLYTARRGLKEGAAFRWYSNGMLAAQEQYVADKEDGLATYYYESGAKQLELLFERGGLVSVQHYDADGGDY